MFAPKNVPVSALDVARELVAKDKTVRMESYSVRNYRLFEHLASAILSVKQLSRVLIRKANSARDLQIYAGNPEISCAENTRYISERWDHCASSKFNYMYSD